MPNDYKTFLSEIGGGEPEQFVYPTIPNTDPDMITAITMFYHTDIRFDDMIRTGEYTNLNLDRQETSNFINMAETYIFDKYDEFSEYIGSSNLPFAENEEGSILYIDLNNNGDIRIVNVVEDMQEDTIVSSTYSDFLKSLTIE